ncbi:unnamed protein product, partial [Closterium sp. NIES-53]
CLTFLTGLRAQARFILLRAATSMGGADIDLVDKKREDTEEMGGALWVEAQYLVSASVRGALVGVIWWGGGG